MAGLGGAAAYPLAAARAQQRAVPVVGFLDWTSPRPNADDVVAFRRGLAESGYVEGHNVAIEYRWAKGQFALLPVLAADLVRHPVAVIVIGSGVLNVTLAAKAATSTIPIVFTSGLDPVKYGLVASLNRPGGNLTGLSFMQGELLGKRLDLLHQLVPQATTVGFLSGASTSLAYEEQRSAVLAAAGALGLQVIILESPCLCDRDNEAAFKTLVQRKAGALIVGPYPFRNSNKIIALAAHHKIPTNYPLSGHVIAGGLMSYSADIQSLYHQLAVDYVARILKGAKPADLPVQQPTRFKLVINLVTAKALGLTVPPSLYALATEVIE